MRLYKNKIYLRLVGGLGNQLYQFGFALYLMQRFGFDTIQLDTTNFHKYRENWGFRLFDVLDESLVSEFVIIKGSAFLSLRLPRLLSFLSLRYPCFGMYSDKNCNDVLAHSCSQNYIFLDGYFEQFSERASYYDLFAGLLRKDLNLHLPDNIVAVNVRGGELARLGISNERDKIFYSDMICKIISKIDNPELHLLSDDLPYARKLLVDIDFEFTPTFVRLG